MKKHVHFLYLAIFFLLIPAFSHAQQNDISKIPDFLLEGLRGKQKNYIERVIRPIKSLGKKNTHIDKKIIQSVLIREKAQKRGRIILRYFQMDLDGNGVISKQEIYENALKRRMYHYSSPSKIQRENFANKIVMKELQPDKNSDNNLSFEEILAYAHKTVNSKKDWTVVSLNRVLALDPDNDGKITVQELTDIAISVFSQFDTDKNLRIDSEEEKIVKSEKRKRREKNREQEQKLREQSNYRKRISRCLLPLPNKGDKILYLYANKGSALSTVSVNGQGAVTTAGTLTIEKGKQPLYLIVDSSYSAIFKFAGEIKRLSKLIVFHAAHRRGRKIGIIGVPKEKIQFHGEHTCIKNVRKSGENNNLKKFLEDVLQGTVETEKLSLVTNLKVPSMTPVPMKWKQYGKSYRPDGFVYVRAPGGEVRIEDYMKPWVPRKPDFVDIRTWSEYFYEFPRGLIKHKPKDIISSGKVEAYDLLPSKIGLIQLMLKNQVKRLPNGFILIQKQIKRYPAGNPLTKYMLGMGIRNPVGASRTSCIIVEATGHRLNRFGFC